MLVSQFTLCTDGTVVPTQMTLHPATPTDDETHVPMHKLCHLVSAHELHFDVCMEPVNKRTCKCTIQYPDEGI